MIDEIFENLEYSYDTNCLANEFLRNEEVYFYLNEILKSDRGLTLDRFTYWNDSRHIVVYGITFDISRLVYFFHDTDKDDREDHVA